MTAVSRKRALLIGTGTYLDGRFGELPCTRADTYQLEQVLAHRSIGAFDSVAVITDVTASEMRYQISEFLGDAEPDELALLYISGHGGRLVSTTGEFVFIASDTVADRIEETAVSASFVNEQLELCRAPQKIAVLDCCFSGGFVQGFSVRDTKSVAASPLTSRGVVVISSSGADEESYGGGITEDGPQPSVFTRELVDALRTGKADTDRNGIISVDELFRFVNQQVSWQAVKTQQRPVMSAYG